jgi:Cu-Zn family superoxide dismutase
MLFFNCAIVFLLTLATKCALIHACQPSEPWFPEEGAKAIAIISGQEGSSVIAGTVEFSQAKISEPVYIRVNITGLQTGQGSLKHGLHVHKTAFTSGSSLVSTRCGSTGGHFNPLKKTHGNIDAKVRHVGDYGNVISDNGGKIVATFQDNLSTLYGPLGIIGRAIVLHQLEDDLGLVGNAGSLATGNAGGRIACGIIGFSQ